MIRIYRSRAFQAVAKALAYAAGIILFHVAGICLLLGEIIAVGALVKQFGPALCNF